MSASINVSRLRYEVQIHDYLRENQIIPLKKVASMPMLCVFGGIYKQGEQQGYQIAILCCNRATKLGKRPNCLP